MARRELSPVEQAQVSAHLAQALCQGQGLSGYLRSPTCNGPWTTVLGDMTIAVLEGFVEAFHAAHNLGAASLKAWMTHWLFEWKLAHPCG